MRDLVLAHAGVRYPMCAGLGEDYIGYIVPAYNYALDPADPYIVEAEGDHYEEVYSLVAARRAARDPPDPRSAQVPLESLLDLLELR